MTSQPTTETPAVSTPISTPTSTLDAIGRLPAATDLEQRVEFVDFAQTYSAYGHQRPISDIRAVVQSLFAEEQVPSLGLTGCYGIGSEDTTAWGIPQTAVDAVITAVVEDDEICVVLGAIEANAVSDAIRASGGRWVNEGAVPFWAVGESDVADFSKPEGTPWHTSAGAGLRAVVTENVVAIGASDAAIRALAASLAQQTPGLSSSPDVAQLLAAFSSQPVLSGGLGMPPKWVTRSSRISYPGLTYDYDPIEPFSLYASAHIAAEGTAARVQVALLHADEAASVRSAETLRRTFATGSHPREPNPPWIAFYEDPRVAVSGRVLVSSAGVFTGSSAAVPFDPASEPTPYESP